MPYKGQVEGFLHSALHNFEFLEKNIIFYTLDSL